MHFSDELVDADSLKFPKKELARDREVAMAKKLIDGMTEKWNPSKYEDEYKTQLMAMIEEKAKHPTAEHPLPKKQKQPSNVIDLMKRAAGKPLAYESWEKAITSAAAKSKAKAPKVRQRKAA